MSVLPVFTVKRYLPSCEISTQHGAVRPSAKGEVPIGLKTPLCATWNAEIDPFPAPPCALETYSRDGFVGENSLPNGPAACAEKGEPGAGVSRPSSSTRKLSMRKVLGSVVPTSTPMRLAPAELKRMSPGLAVDGSGTVE